MQLQEMQMQGVKSNMTYPDYYVEFLKGENMILKAYFKMSQELLKK